MQRNVVLSSYTTFGFGGACKYFFLITNCSDVEDALKIAHKENLPFYVLGGGSSTIVSDQGFSGVILKMANSSFSSKDRGEYVEYLVGAGVSLNDLVLETVDKGLFGLECLTGIPGEVGGGVVQNAGAYGQELKDTVSEVTVYDIKTGKENCLSNSDCGFGYRTSVFKKHQDKIILNVKFKFKKEGVPNIDYQDLNNYFESAVKLTVKDISNAVYAIRKSKSMLYDIEDVDSVGVGSFFTNPVISKNHFRKICDARGLGDIPFWEVSTDTVKLSAGWLIEQAGFSKGYTYKNAGLSSKNALAIVNKNCTCATEVMEFSQMIVGAVQEKFGIVITPEPEFLGF